MFLDVSEGQCKKVRKPSRGQCKEVRKLSRGQCKEVKYRAVQGSQKVK